MKTLNYFFSVLAMIAFLLPAQAQTPEGVSLTQEGWLYFQNQDIFDQVYNQLESEYDVWLETPEEVPEDEDPCTSGAAPLESFEANFEGFSSLRRAALESECAQLEAGVVPEELVDKTWIADDLLSTLLDDKGTVQVGDDIYWLKSRDLTYQVVENDREIMQAIQDGANPLLFNTVVIHSSAARTGSSCKADFAVNGYNALAGSFTYTGSPSTGNITFHWDFGDGNTSSTRNPSHTYATGGNYNVCLNIIVPGADPNDDCSDRQCQTVKVGSGCFPPAFIWNETGVPGELSFSPDLSSIYLGQIVSYNWNFGDGNSSTLKNPVHTFACDKVWNVSLEVTTASGCTTSITIPVLVSSYKCCHKGKADGFAYINGNQNQIKYKQHHVSLPLIRRVVGKMTYYKIKNGKYKKSRADLGVELIGEVYTKAAAGCRCETPQDIGKYRFAPNKKSLRVSKGIGQIFGVPFTFPWEVTYSVDNNPVKTAVSNVLCK